MLTLRLIYPDDGENVRLGLIHFSAVQCSAYGYLSSGKNDEYIEIRSEINLFENNNKILPNNNIAYIR